VLKRGLLGAALMVMGAMAISLAGCPAQQGEPGSRTAGQSKPGVHYLEIVSNDVDALVGLHQRIHGLSFGPADADLGQARVATRADGTLVGIRKPLAAHERPIVRTYVAVEDIQQAVKTAQENGATVAYPPTRQGQRGAFAIVVQGGVEHGLWQQ
jgi:predicted enzyme related to lactoylglutathione lyase